MYMHNRRSQVRPPETVMSYILLNVEIKWGKKTQFQGESDDRLQINLVVIRCLHSHDYFGKRE